MNRIRIRRASTLLPLFVVAACSSDPAPVADGSSTPATTLSAGQTTPAAQPAPVAPAAPSQPLPPGALQVQVADILDPIGGSARTVAARVLLPVGWRSEGGVRWASGGGCQDLATFAWEGIAPDGVTRVELFPTESWQASNSGVRQECQAGNMRDMRSYLTAYIRRRFPGAQPGEYRQRMDFMDAQREYIQARIAMVNNAGLGLRAWADAGELLYTATENGVDISGIVGASGMFYESQSMNPMGGPPLMLLTAGTNGTFGARAPRGQLDVKMSEAIRKSIKVDPGWAAQLFKLQYGVNELQVQGVRDRVAIIVAGGAALTNSTIAANNMATQGYAERSATSDRMQRERIEAIRGVETYDDPVAGGTVQLDNTYTNAWRVTNSDSYILTNDPNFNPGAFNIQAQQLAVTR